ncbi:MAG TPA: adenylate/guanylate cyclase domain-containing protein [Usitatibacteraceae bacterium]
MPTSINDSAHQTKRQGAYWVKRAALFLFAAMVLLLFSAFPRPDTSLIAAMERASFDTQVRFLRKFFPRAAAVEPVLIGIDDRTVAEFPEPLALWHRHLADLLEALSQARPVAVGIDVVLPAQAYQGNLPGGQQELIKSLFKASQRLPVVFALTIDGERHVKTVHPSYMRFFRDGNFGVDQVLRDADSVARRFSERELGEREPLPSFAGQIARMAGKPVDEGFIDFTRGEPLDYIPMQQVIDWLKSGNEAELRRHFDGRVVLVGSLLKDVDRWELPALLTAFDSPTAGSYNQAGVVVHMQALRSLLGAGLIKPLPRVALTLVCLMILACVWVHSSTRLFLLMFVVAPAALFLVSVALMANNLYLPGVAIMASLWIAVVVRAIADALESAVEKNRLKQSFAGSVSPAVLQEMLSGNLQAGVSGQTAEVCVLFSDIRNFTGISEALTPEKVTELLTRYFDRMVAAVHHYDGTIDKFIGDGMMVLFGAPRALPDACGNSVKCAWEMMQSLQALNQEFEAEGLPPLKIGIGINYGKVVVGNIGSTERHNYSAIGDAVNVASRLEGLTKRLATPIVMTDSVKDRLDAGFELIAFGEQPVRGHSALRVWGIAGIPAGASEAALR